jgi:Dynein heavy chain AAA lid domain
MKTPLDIQMSKLESVIPLPLINMVQSLCYILDGVLKSTACEKNKASIERIFVFSIMWAFGGCLGSDKQTDNRKMFSQFLKGLVAKVISF